MHEHNIHKFNEPVLFCKATALLGSFGGRQFWKHEDHMMIYGEK